jgi:hypothetical protein
MTEGLRIKVHLSPGARQDIERLNQRALKNAHSRDEALLEATIVMLHRLNGRRHPTKPLDYDSRFADLSDCDTTYVGADPHEKPPLRIVSRDVRPEPPGGITRREIVAIGARRDSEVYRTAGQRLERPVGVTLDQLAAQRRASAAKNHAPQAGRGLDTPAPVGADLEFD